MPITNLTNICGNGLLNLPAIKRGQVLGPVSAVERAVLDGFGDVFGFDVGGVFDIGDGAPDFQDAVVGAGAKSLLSHGAFEEAFAVGGEIAEGTNGAG